MIYQKIVNCVILRVQHTVMEEVVFMKGIGISESGNLIRFITIIQKCIKKIVN